MDRVDPIRFPIGGAAAVSPAVRIGRRRREEEQEERERGRRDGHGDELPGDDAADEPGDGRPHIDVLA